MFKGNCFPKVVILQAVYYKLRLSLSYRDIEELLKIRGITVDHAKIQRWVFKFTPMTDVNFRKRKRAVGLRWCLDETYIKVKGKWCYLYRAVDKDGKTIDFLLTQRRKKRAAHRFLKKAITQNGVSELINIDKSGSNKEAIRVFNKRKLIKIEFRQCKCLNNIIEQDHRFIKWRISNEFGNMSFKSASGTLSGIETERMIKKNQLKDPGRTPFNSFYSLAC